MRERPKGGRGGRILKIVERDRDREGVGERKT